jgi:hypothetical protein
MGSIDLDDDVTLIVLICVVLFLTILFFSFLVMCLKKYVKVRDDLKRGTEYER